MPPAGLSELSIFGGFLAGLASSLHCVGMCGGISASLMISLSGEDSAADRARTIILLQMGRVASYILAGTVLGAVSANVYFAFDREIAHILLRWVAGATLIYIGFSVAGWAPALARLDRVGAGIAARLSPRALQAVAPAPAPASEPAAASRLRMTAGPVAAGALWGLMPCGMVYAALFYAMMAGDPLQSGLIMAGFGLGSLPAIIASSLGAGLLISWAKAQMVRIAVGCLIIALGLISVAIPWRTIAAICGIPLG